MEMVDMYCIYNTPLYYPIHPIQINKQEVQCVLIVVFSLHSPFCMHCLG